MKYAILMFVVSFCSITGFSQTESKNINSKFRFGFNLGTSYSNLMSKESLPDNAKIVNGVGVKLGVIMDYSITDNLMISPKTELSFNNSKIEVANIDNSTTTYEIFPISIDLMAHFVYKFEDRKATPYLLIGPNFRLPVGEESNLSTEFNTKPDFAIDFGIGLENKTSFFIFAPELRYSYGLGNINENPIFQTLNFHNISLVMNFK